MQFLNSIEQNEARRQLREMGIERMSAGLRILNLRRALGWKQSIAALHLEISVRTVIRHEQGQHRRPWAPRLPLLRRLRELESDYAGEILAYLNRREHEHTWLPSQQVPPGPLT